MKQYKQAIALYDTALSIRPNIHASLFGRGIAKRRLGAEREGSADLEAARAAKLEVDVEFASFGLRP